MLVAATLVGLAAAPAASAHAVLIGTEPTNDGVVPEPPTRVVLRFDEAVETALGSVRVFDANGERVDRDDLSKPAPEMVSVGVDDGLAQGTYTVAWRVISADSDPISGAFVFHVEEPGPQPAGIAAQVLEDTPALVSVLYAGMRFFDYALLLACAGGFAVLLIALPSAERRLRRRLVGILGWLAAALAVVALLAIPLQGAASGSFGLGESFSWGVVTEVLRTRFGTFALVQACLALALVAVAAVLRRRQAGREAPLVAAGAVLGVTALLTPVLSGHAAVSGALALLGDSFHVVAAAAWTGGLAFLVLALVLARGDRWPLATRAVPRFSTMAVVSVILLIAGGTINGYLQVRQWRGLWETTYGLLLLAKIGLVLPLLALGAYNNRYAVPRLRAGIASVLERRRFLRAASVELVIMVGVIGVTAVLVNAPQARTQIEVHGPVDAMVQMGGGVSANVAVEPALAGENDLHLRFEGSSHEAIQIDEVIVSATLASADIGPLRYDARPTGQPGEFLVSGADFPLAGDWQLRIEARRGEFELLTQTVSVSIQKES